ncbi:AMP-binding protein [Thermoleophilia bacterium SCSIO 60948]|nr:AMP-binding protein [Thermoleophilia bacterium SCSIO 60948]
MRRHAISELADRYIADGRPPDRLDASRPPENRCDSTSPRGHNVMCGYHGRPDATAEAISPQGWFRTGDMARVDEDGFVFTVDRKKDLIIRGGYNVYPREIEEVLYEHPAVLEAAVVGVPHAELGEEVVAMVVLRPDADTGAEELRAWAKNRVAAYKYPRQVVCVSELPKGPTGKIVKREIDVAAIAQDTPSRLRACRRHPTATATLGAGRCPGAAADVGPSLGVGRSGRRPGAGLLLGSR